MSNHVRYALEQARKELLQARFVRYSALLHSTHVAAAQGWIAHARRIAA